MGSENMQDVVRRIVAAFNAGRHDEARRLCEAALKRQPGDPTLNHLLAAVLFAKGDTAAARTHVETSLATRPGNAPARLLAGRIARASQDFDMALRHFAKAGDTAPGSEARLEQARTLDVAGRREAARQAWQEVLRNDPACREAAARLGRLLSEDGQSIAAAPLLEQAVRGEAPASAWFDLGVVRQDLHDPGGAAAAYRHALEQRPDHAEAAVNLGIVLQELGDMDAALAAYRTAYRLRQSTFGIIATSLTSAPHGRLWLDREALKRLLRN